MCHTLLLLYGMPGAAYKLIRYNSVMRMRLAGPSPRRRTVSRHTPISWSTIPRWEDAADSYSDAPPPQPPKRKLRKRRIILIIAALVVLATGIQRTDNTPATPGSKPSSSAAGGFDKSKFSINDAASLWVVVNKRRPLEPKDYVPAIATPNVHLNQSAANENMHVASAMAPSLEKLFAGATANGLPLTLASGYRSYQSQVRVYGNEVDQYGQQNADTESARPGFSEHQTGLAADVAPIDNRCVLNVCFGDTREGQWVRDNAWRYGFIIRYPADKTAVTGYTYEPWHLRYVGEDLARELHDKGVSTLEEYFSTGSAPGY